MQLEKDIRITNTPACIEVNFDVLRKALEKDLERFEIVVTADTLADAKKLATQLNETKTIIDDRRKAEVAKASEPVKKFDAQMKDLVIMCAAGRQKILDQVARFEDEVRELVEESLVTLLSGLWEKHGVDSEFQRTTIADLVKISNLTAKGNLTKAARDEVEARVLADKALQEQTDRRLTQLETESYKAGLKAPLQRQHVESFLFEDKEIYTQRMAQLVAIEIERQDRAEARLRADIEREKARDTQAQQAAPAATPQHIERPAASAKPSKGKIAYNVSCTFNVEVPPSVHENAIDAELRRVMKKAGITSFTGVYVQRAQGAA